MSEKNQIDDLFRKGIGNRGLQYDPAHWRQMESLLAKQKKTRLPKVLWWTSASVVVITLFLLSPFKNSDKETTPSSEVTQTDIHTPETLHASETNEDAPITHTFKPGKNKPTEFVHESEAAPAQPGSVAERASQVPSKGIPMMKEEFSAEPLAEGNNRETPLNNPEPVFKVQSVLSIPSIRPTVPGFTIKNSTGDKANNLPRKRRPHTQLYAEAFYNYGWVKHRTDDVIGNWKTGYEKTLPSMHYGVRGRIARNHVSFGFGLGMRQWAEQNNYTREVHHYTFDTSFRLVVREFIKRPDGTYAALVKEDIDTLSHTVTNEPYCANCLTEFRYLVVPVTFQYEFVRGRFSYYTGAGLSLSFLTKASGEYSVLWKANEKSMTTVALEKNHLSQTLLGVDAMLGVRFRIHPLLSVNGSFGYQATLNSMMHSYRQQPDFYQLGLGLEWKLR